MAIVGNLRATTLMVRFNTSFLLKATVITSLCCLPMGLNQKSGFVWTAFLLPISFASLVATQIGKYGQYGFKFKELSDSVVEICATGGRQKQWLTRLRIFLAGACLSLVIGFPMLHLVDPEPIGFWLPIVALYAIFAVMLVGYSARRKVLIEERQFVTDYLLFGRRCWWRRRLQVREGDFLAVLKSGLAQDEGTPEFPRWHALFVCRSRRRKKFVFGMYANDNRVPRLEAAAQRVAKLVDIPYEGYCEPKKLRGRSEIGLDGPSLRCGPSYGLSCRNWPSSLQ